jgi:hypothetical protein
VVVFFFFCHLGFVGLGFGWVGVGGGGGGGRARHFGTNKREAILEEQHL